jgi:hypothetical protein
MPLLALWKSNPTAIGESTIEQIVAIAGDGSLKDDSNCSHELRVYFSETPSGKLSNYVEHCLSSGFAKVEWCFKIWSMNSVADLITL